MKDYFLVNNLDNIKIKETHSKKRAQKKSFLF